MNAMFCGLCHRRVLASPEHSPCVYIQGQRIFEKVRNVFSGRCVLDLTKQGAHGGLGNNNILASEHGVVGYLQPRDLRASPSSSTFVISISF